MYITYPAVFYKNLHEEGYTVTFPDLQGCVTGGTDEQEAFAMAEDALCAYLYEYFIDKKTFPKSESISDISLKIDGDDKDYYTMEGSFKTLVGANMDEYVKRTNTKSVRKNVTIPSYLNEMAKSRGVNFSQVLTDALKMEFDVD